MFLCDGINQKRGTLQWLFLKVKKTSLEGSSNPSPMVVPCCLCFVVWRMFG